jgi:S1-C subfamily serine protease
MKPLRRLLVLPALLLLLAGPQVARAAEPTRGVVVIETALGYQQTSAAGTGVVLTSGGKVLTNNHVIRGATSIRVLVPATGRRYAARVLGYSVNGDIALLQVQQASGLSTATLGTSAGLQRGRAVIAVGNAGGTRRLVTTRGSITALRQSITVHDDQGEAHRLTGLVQVDAELQPGDSGGPLLDQTGRVIGIDTAASVGFAFSSSNSEGYAIPIDRALAITRQIDSGHGTPEIHVGPTAFLGVAVHPFGYYRNGYRPGALVDNVVAGGPADRAGIRPGHLIVAIDGKHVSTPTSIARLIVQKKPGDTIRVTWIADSSGRRASATVRLVTGPPQ